MFSTFSDWAVSAADTLASISNQGIEVVRYTGVLDALESVSTNPNSTAEAAASNEKMLSVPDIMTPPTSWAGSEEEWVWCLEAALRDPNTCAITPAILRADAPLWEEMKKTIAHLLAPPSEPGKKDSPTPTPTDSEAGGSADVATKLFERTGGAYTPASDLVKYIQEHYEVYQVRSYIVPRFTSDEDYWLNIAWRMGLYQQCTDAGQLLGLMQTLSRLPQPLRDIAAAMEPTSSPAPATFGSAQHEEGGNSHQNGDDDRDRKDEAEALHLKDNTEYWHRIRMQYEAIQEKLAWLREMEERVTKEMELASGNVKLLGSLLQRKEASTALGASVLDSCQYHKVKLSRLIADICAAPAEHSEGTLLDSRSGTLFHALLKCNDDVKAVLETYAGYPPSGPESPKRVESSSSASPAPASTKQNSPAPCEESTTEANTEESTTSPLTKPQCTSGSCPVELRAAASGGAHQPGSDDVDKDEESFEAKLPWSMDD
ncbi:conserved hypothetical protein [Leishmania braziliensis MHOM/BR/75/M2904]|uniref:BSD domain-containing protein n=2 Tax=Leishmania braziliensis TaxID=5660 RepID=A4HIM1_LEIBR|nr:conserved hypothetical protein [Leishmania braziliensis MHOM/BR/75/M2904]CAJ2477362.1 unnamed protein product [Leishmania braziliensis]CAM40434.2 conserved hypothetical protein [Leishmania braziliensis MHOM/BR/75/M2904]SYZ68108.1 hypothetical_protein [Leishmania braziliensis MHOM/BR/75/M2904]